MSAVGLDDASWTALASMATSVGTLIGVLVGNRRGAVIEQKASAIKESVTTPETDGRTIAEIVSEAHPE